MPVTEPSIEVKVGPSTGSGADATAVLAVRPPEKLASGFPANAYQ